MFYVSVSFVRYAANYYLTVYQVALVVNGGEESAYLRQGKVEYRAFVSLCLCPDAAAVP